MIGSRIRASVAGISAAVFNRGCSKEVHSSMEFTPYQQYQIQKIAWEECDKRSIGCPVVIFALMCIFIATLVVMNTVAQRVCPIEEKLGLPHTQSWWLTDFTGMSCKVQGK